MALKIGAEDRKKVIIVGVLGVVVIGLMVNVLMSYFGGSSSPAPPPPHAQTAAVQPTSRPASTTPAASEHAAARIPGVAASLDPTLHPEWMAQAESLEYSGRGRNIFSQSSAPVEIEQVKAPVRPSTPVAEVPQGPPPPPPIDLKFFGYEARKDGTRKAFLLHGEDVFIASEGDVVDHRYKVLKIAPLSVQVEDLPYKNAQPLPLVQN
ncbi:MAG TPA: hypothetical protein VKH40_07350 [Alloacidobacterium sp.]|nr:hypothetical protein [Alloacidobacterium sp.]